MNRSSSKTSRNIEVYQEQTRFPTFHGTNRHHITYEIQNINYSSPPRAQVTSRSLCPSHLFATEMLMSDSATPSYGSLLQAPATTSR